MKYNMTKKIAIMVLALIATTFIALSHVTVAHAAGGTSPYITPGPTGEGNFDILGVLGATMYIGGTVFFGYSKFMKKLAFSPR